MGHLLGLAWGLASILGAFAAFRCEASVALGAEVWILPLSVALPQLVLGLCLWAACGRWPGIAWSLPIPLSLAVLWGLRTPGPPPERLEVHAAEAPPDILLLTLDTFRADHLASAPTLAALPSYSKAVTSAPLTGPAHASMLTGLPVLEHGLVRNGAATTEPLVVEELRQAGYATGAFVSGRMLQREAGFGHGFHHIDDRWREQRWAPLLHELVGPGPRSRSGQATVERALRWWEETEGPRLLWVHLFEPHAPYLPPEGWRPSEEEKQAAAQRDQRKRPPSKNLQGLLGNLRSGFGEGQRLMYRSEIVWTDHLAKTLLEGVGPETRAIVVGDHGEGLGEHEEWFDHGGKLYETTVAVPLLTRGLGPAHDELVGVHQVADALRYAAGLGGSLFSPCEQVQLFTSGQHTQGVGEGPVVAIRLPEGKLVQHGDEAPVWFDLLLDPEEARPMTPPESAPTEGLRALVAQRPPEPEPEEIERMRALGYIE